MIDDERDLAGLDYGDFDRHLATITDEAERKLAIADHGDELDRVGAQLDRLLAAFGPRSST